MSANQRQTMNFDLTTILAVIAIIFVIISYIATAPLLPIAVILLGLAIIFSGRVRDFRT